MNRFLNSLFVLTVLTAQPVHAQYQPLPDEGPSAAGALTPQMLQQLEQTVPMTPQLRAVRNALAHNSIQSLTINPDVENGTDRLFTHVIKETGSIANQENSGRCWLFAGLNALRPEVIAKHKMKDFMLSQAYEQFYEELEAANRSLELAITLRDEPIHSRRMDTFLQNLISDGGNWNYVKALIQKYGAVPESVMPDDYSASHTSDMRALLSTRLRKAAVQIREASSNGAAMAELRQIKFATLQDIYKILELCLGKPPETFQWRYETTNDDVSRLETYTPQTFRKKFLGGLDNYVSFANYPGQPMHAHLQWSWERNMADQPDFDSVNIEMKEMSEMALKSVLADQPVWFAANSSAEGDKSKGLWLQDIADNSDLFGIDFSMNKADALAYDDDAPDHAMVITGVDVRDGVPVKWKVENSWGSKKGDKGWFIIESKWFDRHAYQVIIDRRFVPPELLALAKQKAIILPPWDPFTDWGKGR
ncbi:MAG TPA: C1 family peptidase [Candidatus Acidoferrales bacterium]|nr:C1 family peptidase [Candidatus Acidoferrales bacterium]